MKYFTTALMILTIGLFGCSNLEERPVEKVKRLTRTEVFKNLCVERYALAGYKKASKKGLFKCMSKFEYQYQKRFHVDNTNISVESSSSSSSGSASAVRALSSILY